jgi:protein-S-isoprenylcysteine O-methyltransferase Ste14
MNKKKAISTLLVLLQFIIIGLLLTYSSFKPVSTIAILFYSMSIALAAWAILTMTKSKLTIFPIPAKGAILITGGPYQYIRHPMYTAVLIGCMGLIVHHFTYVRFILFIALLIVLIVKLRWEEAMLSQKFEDYKVYMRTTKRLIPFLL